VASAAPPAIALREPVPPVEPLPPPAPDAIADVRQQGLGNAALAARDRSPLPDGPDGGAPPAPSPAVAQSGIGNAALVEREAAAPPPEAAPAAPAAGTAVAPAEEEEDRAPRRSGGSAAITILSQALATQSPAALTAARAGAEREVADDRAALAANPPSLDAPSGLSPDSAPAEGAQGESSPSGQEPAACGIDDQEGEGNAPPPIDTSHEVATAPIPAGPPAGPAVDNAPADPTARAETFRALIEEMPTSDDSVDTSAGPRPTVALTDEADPGRFAGQEAANQTIFAGEDAAARLDMQADEGVDSIYPTLPDATLVAPVAPGESGLAPLPEMEMAPLPAHIADGFNRGSAGRWGTAVDDAQVRHDQAMLDRQQSETEARAESERQIGELEEGTAREQLDCRATARGEVADARAAWRDELDQARTHYDGERTSVRQQLDTDVATEVARAEGQAEQHLATGEAQAERRRTQAEGEAADARAAAEHERDQADGFLDWVASKVRSFFALLQSALHAIFDAFRTAVRFIIEGAKRLAAAAIELGRMAVVGFIRVAGAALELAADVFLAAFPEARDRAKAAIRRGVAVAEDAVNRAAEALRQAVFAVLDLLGRGLCLILDVYEAFYSLMLSVMETLVIGFIELTRGLYRLDIAARTADSQLEGQIYEEMIGADLTQPLPFELTEAEAAARQTAAAAPAGGPDLAGAPVGPMPTEVEVESTGALELDPELLGTVPRAEGESVPFGESGDPERSLAALQVAAGYDPAGAAPAVGTDPAAAATGGAEEPDVSRMSTEERIDDMIRRADPGHTCQTETPTSQQGPGIPLAWKFGPLGRLQRGRYMLGVAWNAIKNWVRCHWVELLLGIIAALAAVALIVAAVVASGGTIGAALGGILAVFTGAMIFYAVLRVSYYIGEYLGKAWRGDVVGGARALARSVAVIAVEIIFAVLTYLTAGVFRALAASLKGAGRLLGAAVRGAGQVGERVLQGAGRLIRRGAVALARSGRFGRAVVRQGRFVLRGVRSGFARGARTLRELGRRLRAIFPFKGFRLIRLGRILWLQGEINPWVDIAPIGESRWVDDVAENATHPGRVPRSGDVIRGTTETGEEVTGRVFQGGRANPNYTDLARLGGLDPDANVIHHALERQLQTQFPGLFSLEEINSLSRLRPVTRGVFNFRVHYSRIRIMWEEMYRALRGAGGSLSRTQMRRAVVEFSQYVDEFITSMNAFAHSSPAYRAAAATNNRALMQQLLDQEIARLISGPLQTSPRVTQIVTGL